ncbi:hypothetical protein pdam_00009968, partial [Pocillopora damicornis]
MAVNFEITGYSGKKEICTTIPKYKESANYFECQKPVIGNRLDVDLKSRRTFEICEVEVFQTKTDKSFSINEDHVPLWWRVDLIAVCKVHLVRIVTATGYKPADLKGLKVLGKLSNTCVRPLSQSNLISYSSRRKRDGAKVGSLDSPTAEPVQTIILSKDTRKRIVSLFLEKFPAKLQFREVEIYNGPLLVVDVCKKPYICGDNYKCVNGKKSHSCICPSGFQITGRYKKCKGVYFLSITYVTSIDKTRDSNFDIITLREAIIARYDSIFDQSERAHSSDHRNIDECASKNACNHERHVKNYHCKNTAGSYECSCRDGYEAVSDAKGKLQTCRDKDECSNPKLNECSKDTTCVNQIGRYICKCVVGYEADKGSKATAIDIKCI